MSPRESIARLRIVAREHDWASCQEACEAAFAELEPARQWELSRNFVLDLASGFLAADAPRGWASATRADIYAFVPMGAHVNVTSDAPPEYHQPGWNSFAKAFEALLDLADAISRRAPDSSRAAADGIAEAIIGRASEIWGGHHPDDWDLWYQSALSGNFSDASLEVLGKMAADPAIIDLQARLWDRLADALASDLTDGH